MNLNSALLAAAGGALGSAARYFVGAIAFRLFGPEFPWGTLAVNVIGCLLMGILAGFVILRDAVPADLRIFLMTGVLGGFTTFSAFALDSYFLYERTPAAAGIYIAASVVLSLAALLAGLFAVRLLP